jgi:hypothetical protein
MRIPPCQSKEEISMAERKITIEYCSNYNSYNGEPVTAGMVLAPIVISDEEFQSNDTIIHENLRTWRHYGVPFRVGFMVVPASDFDRILSFYYFRVNEYFEEHPELRPGRCLLGVDKHGFPILCTKSNICKGCPHRAENLPRYKNTEDYIRFISFQDTHEDDDGNEIAPDIADPHANTEDSALLAVLFAELMEHLEKENSRYATMVRLGSAGYSKEEIFKAVGLKSTFGYTELNRAKKMVKDFLND